MKRATDIEIEKIDTQSDEFQNALKLISYTSQSVFLTGKAGTGKSTFLQYLTHTTKKKYVVLAPTGIAAVNAGGQTLHSFFKIPFKPMLPNDVMMTNERVLRDRLRYTKEHVKLLRSLDLIIIDEVSMVRADTIDFIDRILRVYCGRHFQPFGGKQLLLVGDVFQLEPVITGDMRDVLTYFYPDGCFFFNAKAFSQISIVPIELTKVYRQTDNFFIGLLDRIRVGAPYVTDINLLNSRLVPDAVTDNMAFTMTIATRRDIVDRINQTHLDRLPTPERVYKGEISGDFPESSLPTDKDLVLKEGAQVVFVKNDIDRRWVNGTIGQIVAFGETDIQVQLEDGTKHGVVPEVWGNVKYEYDEEAKKVKEIQLGSFKQYPLKLAWALTIHKSQGLTFERVAIDIGQGAFSGGQTYVALSRCRSLEGIVLRSTIDARDIFVNQKVVAFSRKFNNPRLINQALEEAKADDLYNRAAKAFAKGDFNEAVTLFSDALLHRNDLYRPDVQRLLKQKLIGLAQYKQQAEALEQKLAEDKKVFEKLASEYVELAEACRSEGWDLQPAVSNCEKAISLCPDYSLAWLVKGLALGDMGEIDRAMECYAKAAVLDKNDYRPLYEAGRLQINIGDIGQGMDYLMRALKRNKKIAAIHEALADGYEKVGDEDNAELHRQKARKLKK